MKKEYRGFTVKDNVWEKGKLKIEKEADESGAEVFATFKDGVRKKKVYKTLDGAINGLTKELAPDAEVSAIRAARESLGLSREEVERLIGIPHITLCSWETNHRKCPPWVERLLIAELNRISEAKKKLGV